MQKPICVKCACYFHPKENGIWYMEMKPLQSEAPRGNIDPGQWAYYKLWRADLWKCPICQHELIYGSGHEPVWQDYHGGVDKVISGVGTRMKVFVCDC